MTEQAQEIDGETIGSIVADDLESLFFYDQSADVKNLPWYNARSYPTQESVVRRRSPCGHRICCDDQDCQRENCFRQGVGRGGSAQNSWVNII
jgi:hypothetical protein